MGTVYRKTATKPLPAGAKITFTPRPLGALRRFSSLYAILTGAQAW